MRIIICFASGDEYDERMRVESRVVDSLLQGLDLGYELEPRTVDYSALQATLLCHEIPMSTQRFVRLVSFLD